MGFQLVKKLKFVKKKGINVWKKETFGEVEEKKAQLLEDIHQFDLKEQTKGLVEEKSETSLFATRRIF